MTNILVVDDSEFDHAFVKQMFRGLNRIRPWNPVFVSSGEEALDRLQEQEFDLVLTDIHMPEMTGVQLLKRIQLLDIDVPVVVMTANGSEELVLECLRGGAVDYVIKKRLDQELPKLLEKMNWKSKSHGKARLPVS